MTFNTNIIFVILLLFTSITFGEENQTQNVPEFAGGLNTDKINQCEKQYEAQCPLDTTKPGMEGVSDQWSCMEKKMALDKSCVQAGKIRQIMESPATQIRRYGPISVFYITAIADGIDMYYLVDSKGRLVSLTSDVQLAENQNYLTLKKKYPNIALTTFLYWTQVNEDLFPKTKILSNQNQQLIFRQDLRDGVCVACPRIGVADIAYEFDPQGVYLQAKLLKVTAT